MGLGYEDKLMNLNADWIFSGLGHDSAILRFVASSLQMRGIL